MMTLAIMGVANNGLKQLHDSEKEKVTSQLHKAIKVIALSLLSSARSTAKRVGLRT